MDVTTAPSAAAQAAPPPEQPQAAFKNQDQFSALIERVSNTAGSYSEAEQLDAYTSLQRMAVTGGMIGMGADNQKLYNQVTSSSAIAQKVRQTGQAYTLAMIAGAQSGGASGARQAALDFFDKQSPSAQNILFQGHINAANMSGSTPFASVDSWRTSMLAGIKLDQYVESASAKGDPHVQARTDPKLAAALKLSDAKDQSATWAQQIADLFGLRDPIQDKVDLSDAAKQALGTVASPANPKPAPYEAGALASKTV
ncbi:hypothetical protein [Asticcacaulis sp. 201]|uniref:hypothetical protein n=1 Tax=Asticcacaulis sp. 201 TaxID=3028787 RepID=UPI002915F26A|nr:hypothetical protein [Asticcacaulis sp. 201]MDV6330058.1 hypothetical protein [Asticcacaulis sp. 201]